MHKLYRYLILIIALFTGKPSKAQLAYEEIENLANKVSSILYASSGLKMEMPGSEYYFVINYPKNNFTISLKDMVATACGYTKDVNGEFITITENIDLKKVDKVEEGEKEGEQYIGLRVAGKVVTSSIYKDGKIVNTSQVPGVLFFYDKKDPTKKIMLKSALEELVALAKNTVN
jgi:hypothetical protein